jgi:hypothetical protein
VPDSSSVTGVVLNVTVTQPTAPSFLTVYPDDVLIPPLASNLNYVGGQTVPNLVVMRVPASGVVDFYNNAGTAHVLADVVGYYDGDTSSEAGRFVPGTPFRAFDSRVLSPFPAPGCLTAGGTLFLSGAPAGVGAVVANVTVTEPTSAGYLTAFPNPPPAPLASNLNFVPGQTVPNLVVVRVGSEGAVDFFNSAGCTHVVIDLFGFFTDSTFYAASTDAAAPPFSALRLTAGSLTGP